MARLRRDTLTSGHNTSLPTLSPISPPGASSIPEFNRLLRVVSSGTLFLTHTLHVPHHPEPSSAIRAYAVEKARGGSANTVSSAHHPRNHILQKRQLLSVLAQFPVTQTVLVAPLGGNEEGRRILEDLESEGINTQYCKIWPNAGVPTAWILHSSVY